jgi:hypothetical protein
LKVSESPIVSSIPDCNVPKKKRQKVGPPKKQMIQLLVNVKQAMSPKNLALKMKE